MVLLCEGVPFSWKESLTQDLRSVARRQLVAKCHESSGNPEMWGDEMEYSLVTWDTLNPPLLRLGAIDIRPQSSSNAGEYVVEYASWMIEGLPREAHASLWDAEKNFLRRRMELQNQLPENARLCTMAAFPMLGCGTFTDPTIASNGPIAMSDTIGDECITPFVRFHSLTKNIRERRGKKVAIRLHVERPVDQELIVDAMAYGMGCCSLQVTTQASCLTHALALHDAFAILSPIFLALSASTPALAGHVLQTDTRWHIISQAVDDRTEKEQSYLPPRFGPVDLFVHRSGQSYNDKTVVFDETTRDMLVSNGVPEPLARTMGQAVLRDPLVLFPEQLDEDATAANAMNTFLSTHWKTVRMKPPSASVHAWLVEFRPMELQPSDFENAALAVVSLVAARALASQPDKIPYTSMTVLQSQIDLAERRDAVTLPRGFGVKGEQSIAEVLGYVPGFVFADGSVAEEASGVLQVCWDFLEGESEKQKFCRYAHHLSRLAYGIVKTPAARIRAMIYDSPGYDADTAKIPSHVMSDIFRGIFA